MVIIFNRIKEHYGLRWKLFVGYILVAFIPVVIISRTINTSIEDYFLSNKEGELKRKLTRIADLVSEENYIFDKNKSKEFKNAMLVKSIEESMRILILDNKGTVIDDTNSIENGKVLFSVEILEALKLKSTSRLQDDNITMYTSVPIIDEKSNIIGIILGVSTIGDINELSKDIKDNLLILNIVMLVLVTIGVLCMSNIIVAPLNKLLKVVNMMSEGHLDQRIEVKGHDELSKLCIAFNNMNDRLEEVEHTREEFVSNVSHELKTPLSSIKVLSESILLQESVPEETYKEFLQDINSEVDRMTFIVNDLLILVKLNQKAEVLNIQEVELNKILYDILKRLKPIAEKNNIELTFNEIRKINVEVDEMKLSLALSNLIDNGIKYTQEGGSVKVTVDADHQNAFVTVSDTGVGIAEEEQSKVFNRFYRVDKTRNRGTGGTGLGLSITHSTVLLHNGSIKLYSKEDEGTTFTVRIPIKYTK